MCDIKIGKTGILFRHANAHVSSVHAYFPSVVSLGAGEFVASVVLGEAFEATNLNTHLFRSVDHGETWVDEGELCPVPEYGVFSNAARLTLTPTGELVAFIMRHDRTEHPNEGLTNVDTLGFVPTELLLRRSKDKGKTWGPIQMIETPLVGPSFELCSPITILSDGRWLLPTSTWQGWAGDCPYGIRMVALESHDAGVSWPEYKDVMREEGRMTYFWESKIVELADGRLLSVAWVHDADKGVDRANHFSLSDDGGSTWTVPATMNIHGQTMTPHVLPDGRVLVVYRRMDRPGLWATVAYLDGDTWVNEKDEPIWGASAQGLTGTSDNMVDNFTVLRFGAPCITPIDEKTVMVSFWCYEDCVSVIRWYRVQVS